MEIKKQITGMRRLLNDSSGRIYQRVGKEGEKLKEEPQDLDLVWPQRLNSSAETPQSLHPPSRGAWNELAPQSGQFSGQYGTRSRTFQSQSHTAATSNGGLPMVNSSVGSNCCTCNCQSTLQAILQELKTMRKLMQFQAANCCLAQEKQEEESAPKDRGTCDCETKAQCAGNGEEASRRGHRAFCCASP